MNATQWITYLIEESDQSVSLSKLFKFVMASAKTAKLDTVNELCLLLPVDDVDPLFITGLLRISFPLRMHLSNWKDLRSRFIEYCISNDLNYLHLLRGLLDDSVVCRPRLMTLHPSLIKDV